MDGDNFTKFKITEGIGKGNIEIIPDLIVSGNDGKDESLSGLMVLQLLQLMQEKKNQNGSNKTH